MKGLTLRLKDVIIVSGAPEPDPSAWCQQLAVQTGKLVIELAEGMTLETIDEDQMRECGWVRA